jgi:hypothetical protein
VDFISYLLRTVQRIAPDRLAEHSVTYEADVHVVTSKRRNADYAQFMLGTDSCYSRLEDTPRFFKKKKLWGWDSCINTLVIFHTFLISKPRNDIFSGTDNPIYGVVLNITYMQHPQAKN